MCTAAVTRRLATRPWPGAAEAEAANKKEKEEQEADEL